MSETSAVGEAVERRGGFFSKPATRLGWWSFALGVTFIVLMGVNQIVFMNLSEDVAWRQTVLPFYGIGMLLVGLASGVLAVIAIRRRHERSWLVWLPVVAGLFVLMLVLGEFLVPH